jgi:hypothetical protein
MTTREKGLLCEVLKRYPAIPADYAKLSRQGGIADAVAAQKLLEDALSEERAEARARLDKFLAQADRFQPLEQGFGLALKTAEVDWLLRILSNIRVGSWLKLGSPEKAFDFRFLKKETAPIFWAMEISGYFQTVLLDALGAT